MSTNSICTSCPHGTPEGFMATILPTKSARKKFAAVLKESGNQEAQKRALFISLVIHVFGEKEARGLSAQTVWEVHQCLESIWNLGNRGMNCSEHHMRGMYEKAGRWPLCLRKYMMEESITFIQGLWKESGQQEEQFQAFLRDRWPVHQMAFMC